MLPKDQKIDWPIAIWFIVLHAIAIIGPFYFFSWGAVLTAVILYFVTGMFGITLGYHRLLTHRTFKAPKWVERVLATCGTLALQRSPLEWVAHHRMHHAYSDTDLDPHNAREGFWWSHMGWMTRYKPDLHDRAKLRKFARDIAADPYMMWLAGEAPQIILQVALGLTLLFLGGWSYVIWGVFVRTAVVYHVTWFVNSATHKWGYRNYQSEDLASNVWWVGLLAFGEGWHNNHHTYPEVAPAGHRWYEIDITWYVIKAMRALGLAWDVKVPPVRVAFDPPAVAAGAKRLSR
jgi:fatty-acid desaturase